MHARTVGTHIIAYDTGDKLQELDHRTGLICVNEEQASGLCQDYEVRYLCRKKGKFNNSCTWLCTKTSSERRKGRTTLGMEH